MKSHKRKIEEGRCQGYGKDYTPFILVREYKGRGTASVIWDPFEERLISTACRRQKLRCMKQSAGRIMWNISANNIF